MIGRWRRFREWLRSFFVPTEIVQQDHCAHCWRDYPARLITRLDLPLTNTIELRGDNDELVGYIHAQYAQNIPLCHVCVDDAPVLYLVIVRPWGVDYIWQNPVNGKTYQRKRSPEKLGIHMISPNNEEEH